MYIHTFNRVIRIIDSVIGNKTGQNKFPSSSSFQRNSIPQDNAMQIAAPITITALFLELEFIVVAKFE